MSKYRDTATVLLKGEAAVKPVWHTVGAAYQQTVPVFSAWLDMNWF